LSAAAGSLRGWGLGARAAGIVIALGYLLGLVGGPLPAVVGALALMTLGRCAAAGGSDDLVLGGALAAIGGALQVGALRWETLDLGRLRGAQAVLGPTVLVEPAAAAAASWVAVAAATAALAAWLATARLAEEGTGGFAVRAVWIGEAAVGAFALATVFWGGSVPRGSFGGGGGALAILEWGAAVGVVAGAAVAGAAYLARVPGWRGWVVVSAAAVVAGAATVVAGAES
jgi:hypothetical protein